MGFVLFKQSGTFNPLDYGLNVGDILNVIAVGGGGGGGIVYNSTGYGGNGGPSSFGSHVTALGGNGGGKTVQGAYNSASISTATTGASAGAGGWLPNLPIYGGGGLAFTGTTVTSAWYINRLLAGVIATTYTNIEPGHTPISVTGSILYPQRGLLCSAGGNLAMAGGGYGYGAGGGAGLSSNASTPVITGGSSGEIKFANIQLSSTSAIAASIGGGGGGGLFRIWTSSYDVMATDGSAGAAGVGASVYSSSSLQHQCGSGGYGDTLAGDIVYGTSRGSGGGAGGCIAVFW